jgi:hypothetical protein
LPAVAADARALRDVLVHPARCGYAPDKVRLLTGAESSRKAILDGLDWLGDQLAAMPDGDSAILYFSGHGHVEGGEHYLIPYDLNLRRIRSSAIRAADFADAVAQLTPRRLLVVLDCCHAAGMAIKNAAPAPFAGAAIPPALFLPEGKSLAAGPLASGAGRAVLSSCQPGEAFLSARRRPHEPVHLSPDRSADRARAAKRWRARGAGFRPDQPPPASRAAKRAGAAWRPADPGPAPHRQLPGRAGAWRRRTRQGSGGARPIGASAAGGFLAGHRQRFWRRGPGRWQRPRRTGGSGRWRQQRHHRQRHADRQPLLPGRRRQRPEPGRDRPAGRRLPALAAGAYAEHRAARYRAGGWRGGRRVAARDRLCAAARPLAAAPRRSPGPRAERRRARPDAAARALEFDEPPRLRPASRPAAKPTSP